MNSLAQRERVAEGRVRGQGRVPELMHKPDRKMLGNTTDSNNRIQHYPKNGSSITRRH